MLAAVWMFAAILLLATLFLGREGCLRFTIAIICLEVVGVILMQDVSPVLFMPLNEAVNLIIMLLSGLILPPIVALIIYRNIAEQEKYFRQSKRARWEIEQRVAAERAQQQLLQQANLKLDRRALQLQAAAEVSRATGSILDSDELIRQVVELTRERFGLYYVGLYLVDFAHEAGRWAVLRGWHRRSRTEDDGERPPDRSRRRFDGGLVHCPSTVAHRRACQRRSRPAENPALP